MKKLFILFFAMGLLAACNNNNPFADKNKGTAKDEKTDREKKDDDDDNGNKNKNNNSNWSTSQRNDWRDKCLTEYRDEPNAKQICACVLDKMEQKFPDESDARSASERESDKIIEACEAAAKNGDDDDGGYIKKVDRDDGLVGEDNGRGWTNLQRQKFIQGCATSAQRAQGFTAQQANSYCDCMTRKIERKYTFDQAARLTAEDLNTQEWIEAAADCRSRF